MPDPLPIESLIRRALAEDLGEHGDITSFATIPEDRAAKAVMRSRADGIVAGVNIAQSVFETVDPDLKVTLHLKSGDALEPGIDILTVEGPARSILTAERTALNFISHLSGIATMTNRYVQAVEGTQAKILDTRKTTPGLRELEKYAVKTGGGQNHRFGLYDMVLIKDNHIAVAGGISEALNKVQNAGKKIEIEVDTLEQLDEVLTHGGADIVMLDNMSPDMLKKAVEKVGGKLMTEASGGITLENVRNIAETGVDLISIGALTHSAPALDIGLDINKNT